MSSADKHLAELCSTDADLNDHEPLAKRTKSSHCSACLGILQELCDATKIIQDIKHEDFETKAFVLSLTVPICLETRQLSFFIYLKDKFPETYSEKSINDIPSVKEVWKWAVGPLIEKELLISFSINSPFDIVVIMAYKDDEHECHGLNKLCSNENEDRCNKKKITKWSRSKLGKLLDDAKQDEFRKLYPCPPTEPTHSCYLQHISCSHSPIFFAGRYNKYSRTLPQTPWLINGDRIMNSSVQELICKQIAPKLRCSDIIFSASGREDVDVRTLGRGRPFVLQLINPHRTEFTEDEIRSLQEAINSSTSDILVRDLQIIPKEATARLKEGEEEKVKTYTALCFSRDVLFETRLDKMSEIKELKLMQKTPVRVLHRRPAAIREKIVHEMSAELVDKHHFRMKLKTQAGTYIKEFVHGDFGRTQPNLGTLLGLQADILELDVESIELDWPPEIK